jgi:hypothetical protein
MVPLKLMDRMNTAGTSQRPPKQSENRDQIQALDCFLLWDDAEEVRVKTGRSVTTEKSLVYLILPVNATEVTLSNIVADFRFLGNHEDCL